MPAGLEIQGLVKRFADTAAVAGVDLSVRPGELFTVLGPSGCGKTTLLRSVAGILGLDAGRISIGGRDVSAAPIWARRIGLVFQSYALFPHMTVADNVAFGLTMRGVPRPERRERVMRALATVRLEGYEKRRPAELSGGQQQRVALARAIVVEPDLLLLDEPLSNLDARLREDMRAELSDLQRRVGITTVLVTHDIHEAFALSDRIAVMSNGRIEQVDTPVGLYERPASSFVARFLGPVNEWPGAVDRLDGGEAEISSDGMPRIRLAAAAGWQAGTRVTVLLRPERVALTPAAADAEGPLGRIEAVTNLGNLANYRVAFAGRTLLAQAVPDRGNGLEVGRTVRVGWRDADLAAVAR